MKKLFFACAIVGCSLNLPTASAQNICCAPQASCCCESFDGFYVGGNVGVFSHVAHRNDRDGFLTDNNGISVINTNVTAGVLLGYDWQCGNKLLGFVADWNWVNTRVRYLDEPNGPDDNFIHADFHWFTTLRVRTGVVICDALVYVTGGAAVTRIRNRWGDPPTILSHTHHQWGWTGGFGTEFLLGCNWSLAAEFLFLHFSEHVRSFTVGATTFSFSHSDSAYVGRLVLNYRFGDLFSCCR